MSCDKDMQLSVLAEKAVAQQYQNAAEMRQLVGQMAQIAMNLDKRVRMLEDLLLRKVTVSSVQAKAIGSAVREQARALCTKYALDYARHGAAFRAAIQRDVKAQYGISDIHDLPASYYDLAIKFISGWSSFALVCKAREKDKARR